MNVYALLFEHKDLIGISQLPESCRYSFISSYQQANKTILSIETVKQDRLEDKSVLRVTFKEKRPITKRGKAKRSLKRTRTRTRMYLGSRRQLRRIKPAEELNTGLVQD